jgi:hypothetical protein
VTFWRRIGHIFTVPMSDHLNHDIGWWKPVLLHLSIAFDDFVQAWFPYGTIGVTISSRIGIAAAHGHRWGLIGWWLLDHTWPFGRDPVTGESHCKGAVRSDIERAVLVIRKLAGDPVLQSYLARLT